KPLTRLAARQSRSQAKTLCSRSGNQRSCSRAGTTTRSIYMEERRASEDQACDSVAVGRKRLRQSHRYDSPNWKVSPPRSGLVPLGSSPAAEIPLVSSPKALLFSHLKHDLMRIAG